MSTKTLAEPFGCSERLMAGTKTGKISALYQAATHPQRHCKMDASDEQAVDFLHGVLLVAVSLAVGFGVPRLLGVQASLVPNVGFSVTYFVLGPVTAVGIIWLRQRLYPRAFMLNRYQRVRLAAFWPLFIAIYVCIGIMRVVSSNSPAD